MVELFDVEDVNHSASTFNPEKLLWLNKHYIKSSSPEHVARHLSWHLGERGIDPASGGPELVRVVAAQQERSETLVEMADNSRFFYLDFDEFEEKAAKKNLKGAAEEPLRQLRSGLAALSQWEAEPIHAVVLAVAEGLELKLGKVAQPLRVAVSGQGISPPIDITLELVGRDRVLERIDRALAYIAKRTGS